MLAGSVACTIGFAKDTSLISTHCLCTIYSLAHAPNVNLLLVGGGEQNAHDHIWCHSPLQLE
jgi:hypothetical protein